MRLDWFLPALRKTSDGRPMRQTRLGAIIRRCLPTRWHSNHRTKRRGVVRRTLRWLGTSWLHSPARRVTQAACFVLFLWLFFYVCWPYTAAPVDGRISTNWTLADFDQESGRLTMRHDAAPRWVTGAEHPIHLIDDGIEVPASVGQFRVMRAGVDAFTFSPHAIDDDLVERILVASGAWSVGEQAPNQWPAHYTDDLARKEFVPADLFLVIDPLVSISTAIASRQWVWSLAWAATILLVCVVIPRGFCGYVCPLGTLIDLFDWSVARRVQRFRVPDDGWWVHLKYYLLLGSLICACLGVLVTGYVAAIPVVTRGLLMVGEPIQSGLMRGWHLVPFPTAGTWFSLALFFGVLLLGFLQPRFWCKYVCPSGAVFSLSNLFRVSERKVESTCIHCNKCVEVCPFDAIKPDFTTRVTDCTLCQTCGGVCPTHAIKFVERGNVVELKVANDPPTDETPIGRRGFLSAGVGTAASVAGGVLLCGATRSRGSTRTNAAQWVPVRPPGSVPEKEFLQMCIRCGECFKACPNNVLQPMSFQQGLDGLWTPHVVADWAGCESSCNACGQVCPTGAIRALPLEEKRHARMGLAIVNTETCLPFADRETCQLCVDECDAAGYHAIEFTRVHTQTDEAGDPVAESGYLAPVVIDDKCVGCGLCQTRCFGINVQQHGLLDESAIVIEAGLGKEDRKLGGSYINERVPHGPPDAGRHESPSEFYIPPSSPDQDASPADGSDDPFGIE